MAHVAATAPEQRRWGVKTFLCSSIKGLRSTKTETAHAQNPQGTRARVFRGFAPQDFHGRQLRGRKTGGLCGGPGGCTTPCDVALPHALHTAPPCVLHNVSPPPPQLPSFADARAEGQSKQCTSVQQALVHPMSPTFFCTTGNECSALRRPVNPAKASPNSLEIKSERRAADCSMHQYTNGPIRRRKDAAVVTTGQPCFPGSQSLRA